MKFGLLAAACAGALSVAGCGGGSGGSGGGSSSGGDAGSGGGGMANAAPAFTSGASTSVAEFTSGVFYTAAAPDPNNDALTFSIVGGADAARFSIAGSGALQFVAAPASAAPDDSDRNNVYQVVLQVSDGRLASTLALTVTVTAIVDDVAVRRIATGFDDPVAISPIAQTRDLLVIEREGDLFRIDGASGNREELGNLFSGQLSDPTGSRVLALAALPDFATSGRVLAMVQTPGGYLFIQQYTRNVALWGSGYPAFVVDSGIVYSDENSGWIGYAPDGTAYALMTDGSGTSGSGDAAQDPGRRSGKVIRITPNPDPYAYASPVFFLTAVIGSGLHQPTGGAFTNGELIFADRGRTVAEEVNRLALPAGGPNFGWPFKEGAQTVQPGAPAGVADPALQYDHGTGTRAGTGVVAGQVYSGAIPSLAGRYVLGDKSGAIWTVPLDRLRGAMPLGAGSLEVRTAHFAPDLGALNRLVAIASDATGVLYLLDGDGELFRVDPG